MFLSAFGIAIDFLKLIELCDDFGGAFIGGSEVFLEVGRLAYLNKFFFYKFVHWKDRKFDDKHDQIWHVPGN